MRLCAAYAASLLLTGAGAAEATALWRRVLARAESAGDESFTARALWGLWNAAMTHGDIHAALRYATRFELHADRVGVPWQKLCAKATIAVSLHCFGELAQARERLEQTLDALDAHGLPGPDERNLAVDPRIFGAGTLARVAWMQGDTAFALEWMERAVNFVRADMLEPSFSHLLAAVVVPIELACGELEAASRHLALLRSQTALNRIGGWQDYGECLAGQLEMLSGRAEVGLARLEAGLVRLASQGFARLTAPLICAYAQALVENGRIDEAQNALDKAQQGRALGDHNFAAELLRVRGRVERARAGKRAAYKSGAGETSLEAAHRYFRDAMALAREQSARLFELRAALDLAESLMDAGEGAQVSVLLRPLSACVERIAAGTRAPEARRFEELLRIAGAEQMSPVGQS
jgi:exonuclease VII small subunit